MKKIIKGKRYDTATAAMCGCLSCGDAPLDSRHYSETLYRKRTGEFFLYGEGGALSRYGEEVSLNAWQEGEKIIPLTEAQAKEWAGKNLDREVCEKLFAAKEPEEGVKICCFSLDSESISRLTQLSKASGLSRSKIICDLIGQAYQERKELQN